ncbi:M56 family metallopeptidase [Christiangramia sabulilitoris]|uniref:M56 family metallopeptidase n=1 Tax=Christiangramia sabulilitoris TaxID=2583991 RepID=UPI0014099161|nr:M56 family metallopeptidase [Christiangramia sabulilitoris]
MLRFSIQLGSVFRIINRNKFQKRSDLKYVEICEDQLPFSFFRYIVYNPAKHSEKELDLILTHEKVHAKQAHSADILLVNILTSILWFNPFAWLYRKAVVENLEFIADRETIKNTSRIKEYQQTLLKVSVADLNPALTNQFYQSLIKKRIIMLNTNSSSKSPAWKLNLLIPVLLGFMFFYNVRTEAQVINSENENTSEIIKNGKSITISAQTSEIALKKVEKFFEPDGLVLEFNDVKIKSGKIISISSTLTDPVKGLIKNYNQSNSLGIKPVRIYLNEDNDMGFETMEDADNYNISNQQLLRDLGEKPLYVINGKPVKSSDLKGKYIKVNGNVEVKTGVNSTALYGSRGKDGVVIISEAEILNEFTDDSSFKDNLDFSQEYIMVDKDGKPFPIKLETRIHSNKNSKLKSKSATNKKSWTVEPDVHVTGIEFSTDDKAEIIETLSSEDIIGDSVIGYQHVEEPIDSKSIQNHQKDEVPGEVYIKQAKPIIVVNGQIKDQDYDPEVLDPEHIANVKVIKGTGAIEKYGKKANAGVIEITTKDHAGNTTRSKNVHMHVVHKDQNDKSLENLKKMIRDDANIDAEFSNIKRNAAGVITGISINAETAAGKKASASFSNSDGIPMILIGLDKKDRLIISSNYATDED